MKPKNTARRRRLMKLMKGWLKKHHGLRWRRVPLSLAIGAGFPFRKDVAGIWRMATSVRREIETDQASPIIVTWPAAVVFPYLSEAHLRAGLKERLPRGTVLVHSGREARRRRRMRAWYRTMPWYLRATFMIGSYLPHFLSTLTKKVA